MRFGVPYQGSKNKIAEWVIDNLPEDEILVDLFAGGCAVTHAAMLSGKWNKVIANDIGDAPELFRDAIEGKYADEKLKIWQKTKSPYLKRDMEKFIHKHKKGAGNGKRTKFASRRTYSN